MILSALLTSVGINLGLCFLFFTLYSILRKQPSNLAVYAPRLIAQRKNEERSRFNLDRFIPSTGWVREAWQPSEEQLLSIYGFDSIVFMRIFTFSLKVFTFAGIVGIGVLLPINYVGNQLTDDTDLANTSLDSFSISNVDDGSNWLWAHFCAAYIFTGVVCSLLYIEYDYISSKRIAYFSSCKPSPSQFTVLVRDVRVAKGESVSENVGSFFSEMYPDTYFANLVVHKTRKLRKLMDDAEKLSKYLARLKLDGKSSQRFTRDGILGIMGRRVNFIDHFEKKLEDLEEKIKTEQSSLAEKEVPSSFVSFKTRLAAALALHIQQRTNPSEWVTEQAPDPEDIHWPIFSMSFLQQWVSRLTVIGACVTITILFFIPVLLVQGLANLEQLETWFPFLSGILDLTVITELITGYLPSLILQLFLSLIPRTMLFLSSMQGFIAFSQIQKSACIKVLWFTTWNVFFANVLSGSALYRVSIFLEPSQIPTVLAEAVPSQASFFISYVVTSGWTNISSELFRLVPLIRSFIGRLFCRKDDDDDEEEVKVPPIPYHSAIPKIAFFGLLGVTYFFLAPLILPFILIFYCLGYIVYRNQIMNVYAFKYDTYGKFWPIMHNSMIFSLILMHIIAIGIFGLKTLPLAAGLMVPLPILTILFNEYCRKRFEPMFKAFPAECLIKKDKEDQTDPTMDDFYSKLVTAYGEPTLKRRLRIRGADSVISPLLRDAES